MHAQEFVFGEAWTLPEPRPGLPIYAYAPDGHHTVVRRNAALLMFWPGEDSYRTTGSSLFDQGDCVKVLPKGGTGDFDNGGAWLYSLVPWGGRRMLAFYHAEDHAFPLSTHSGFTAYKSIARCTSEDAGPTWGERTQILTAHRPKPRKAAWSGLGDHCTVWDEPNQRYVCFFRKRPSYAWR